MDYEVEERQLPPQPTAYIHLETSVEGIPSVIGPAYGEIAAYLEAAGVAMTGMPFARFYEVAPERVVFDAGFPVARAIEGRGRVERGELPGGPAAAALHIGPYDAMEPCYAALTGWAEAHGRTPAGAPWEIYFSDPVEEPDPAKWRTEVVLPLGA